jgi:hypothetical protein
VGRKFISQKKQTREELFDSLVKNAIDFLDSSLDNLEKRPKNSIVDFYTSIELFLKARLMHEHWTLIISKPENANIDSFMVGDFHSVFLEDVIKRLKSIINEPLPESTIANFKALGEHRNQIVHFAHTDYSDIKATKAGVVVEQWSSWHHLHELIGTKWLDIFKVYSLEINRIHQRMMQQTKFIQARYDELEPKIKIEEKKGKKVIDCLHCKMHSGIITEEKKWGVDYNCMVCGVKDLAITPLNETIECSECNKEFKFFDSTLKHCPNCKVELTTKKLIDLCENKYKEGDGWWEEGQAHIASCHECQNERPSVFFIDNLWSCVSCFDRGWQAIFCPNCDEFVTGDMDKLKYFACHKCEEDVRRNMEADGF